MTCIQTKLKSAEKSLAQSKKANETHGEDIAVLERELVKVKVDRLRDECEESLQSQSQSQDCSGHLEEEEVSFLSYF